MKTTYDEWYGTVSMYQLAAYRKFNVSPSDHDDLVAEFGPFEHAKITKVVKERSASGVYQPPCQA